MHGINISPATAGFIKGLVMAVIVAVLAFLSDATNLSFISNPAIVALIVAVASSIESSMKAKSDGTKGIFGAVSIKR